RVAIALARTRLMAGRFPYYLLADSYEGRKKERELNPAVMLSEAKHLQEILRPFASAQGDANKSRGVIHELPFQSQIHQL
ncbi:MAG: hypothetical protein Q8M58_06100, partial [Anaerolineales bacterium]|nr:hypothetical protein [Anaerolineales bacterium]